MKKLPCIHITDSMTQGAVTAFFVHEGEGSDALGIVPYPDTQLVFSSGILYRSQWHRNFFSVSYNIQNHILSVQNFQILHQFLFVAYLLFIKCHNIISGSDNIFCRLPCSSSFTQDLSCINDQNALCFHINSHCTSAYIHRTGLCGSHFDILKWYHSQKSAGQQITAFSGHSDRILKFQQRMLQKLLHLMGTALWHMYLIRNLAVHITVSQPAHSKYIQPETPEKKFSVSSSSVHSVTSFRIIKKRE